MRATVSLLCCLLAVSLVAPTIAGVGAAQQAESAQEVLQTDDLDADRIIMRATVEADGTATWRVEYRIRLADDETRTAFDELQADIEADDSDYEARFEARMERTVSAAAEATGREMTVENVRVETEQRQLPQEYGIVAYEFGWSQFAAVEDDRLVVGDAIYGLFLDEESRLVVDWPDGYEAKNVSPEPDERNSNTAIWQGPAEFATDEPRIVAAPESQFPSLGVIGVAAGVLALAVGGTVWLHRDGRLPLGVASTAAKRTSDETVDETARSEPPEELLSNEERVLRLLERNGGRMKQQDVVAELGWTEARTSQVVSGLREDGDIESFRLGRENVLTLPDDDSS
ncbi:DUF7345 domain-containing protein [Haloferacaceae archaeon DSL9]